MEEKFIAAWLQARQKAEAIGVRLRPMAADAALQTAHRALSGHRESDGFVALANKNRLDLSLEALATDRRYTALFNDEEVNTALDRLLAEGYRF